MALLCVTLAYAPKLQNVHLFLAHQGLSPQPYEHTRRGSVEKRIMMIYWDLLSSYRWLEGADQAANVCAAACHITVIADRESDICEAFTRRPANVDLVVRSAKDRSFGKDQPSLFAMADALPASGERTEFYGD